MRLFLIACIACWLVMPHHAQYVDPEVPPTTTRILIGGGYHSPALEGFIRAILPHAHPERVYILIIPVAQTYFADELSADNLLRYAYDAERRRIAMQTVCDALADKPCAVVVMPTYTRLAAESDSLYPFFEHDLAGVFFSGR